MQSAATSSTLKLATWNIRFAPPEQRHEPPSNANKEHPWVGSRREAIVDQILWELPDVLGCQEVLWHQLQDLAGGLKALYEYVGVCRDDGKQAGEAVPIFYNKQRLELLTYQHFWLSKHPEVPGSKDWDASQTRMATLAHFRERSSSTGASALSISDSEKGQMYAPSVSPATEFYVLNTHFDDGGRISREKASEIILAKLKPILKSRTPAGKAPLVVVMGDLNSPPEEEGYRVLTGHRYVKGKQADPDTFIDSRHALSTRSANGQELLLSRPYGSNGTFTSFEQNKKDQIIDFVLLGDNGAVAYGQKGNTEASWRVIRYGVLPNRVENGQYDFRASDHCMVVSVLAPV